jgi:hypothetical protein
VRRAAELNAGTVRRLQQSVDFAFNNIEAFGERLIPSLDGVGCLFDCSTSRTIGARQGHDRRETQHRRAECARHRILLAYPTAAS